MILISSFAFGLGSLFHYVAFALSIFSIWFDHVSNVTCIYIWLCVQWLCVNNLLHSNFIRGPLLIASEGLTLIVGESIKFHEILERKQPKTQKWGVNLSR